MKWLIVLLALAGCVSSNLGRRELARHGYRVLRHLYSAPQPTVGPLLCPVWYAGDVYVAQRLSTVEEHCLKGVEVHVLVCCSYYEDCEHREINAYCAENQ